METKTIEIITVLVFAAIVIFFLLRMFIRDERDIFMERHDENEGKEDHKSVDDFMYWRH
jgi:hypothetical protein